MTGPLDERAEFEAWALKEHPFLFDPDGSDSAKVAYLVGLQAWQQASASKVVSNVGEVRPSPEASETNKTCTENTVSSTGKADMSLLSTPTVAQEPAGARELIDECRSALAEELAGWDLDPPLHHVKQAHDRCVAWLAGTSRLRCKHRNVTPGYCMQCEREHDSEHPNEG